MIDGGVTSSAASRHVLRCGVGRLKTGNAVDWQWKAENVSVHLLFVSNESAERGLLCFHPLLSHNWPRSRTNPIVHRSLLLSIPSGEMRMCRARNFTVSCTRTILCVVFFLSAPCVGTFLRKHILLVSPPMPRASRLCSQMSAIDVFNVDESSSPVGSYIRLSVRKVWQFVRNRFAFCFSLLG